MIAAWEGAWTSHVWFEKERSRGGWSDSEAPIVALDIRGSHVTASNGRWEIPLMLEIKSPCEVTLLEKKDGAHWTDTEIYALRFYVDGDTLAVGHGDVGYRRGQRALVCADDGVYIVDGTCTFWRARFTTWDREACRAEWHDDELSLHDDHGDATVVSGHDGILTSTDFRESVEKGFHARAKDFAEAKAKVRAERAKPAHDPR